MRETSWQLTSYNENDHDLFTTKITKRAKENPVQGFGCLDIVRDLVDRS